MRNALIRKPIGDQIHFSSVQDPKFKHNRLAVYFVMPLSRETASVNAVVPFILTKGCRECPDFSALNARLDELYGAGLGAGVLKRGGHQVLKVAIRGLSNRYALEGEDIAGRCADLLASVVLDPKLDEKGLLDQKDVDTERRYILDTIESEINDKRSYALSQCVQVMCQGEPTAVRKYGYREDAEAITPESATAAYRAMLQKANIEIIFVGSGDPAGAEAVFAQRFGALKNRSAAPYASPELRTHVTQQKEQVEQMDLSQSKLVMGMRTGDISTRQQLNAARVFTALYGGTPFSKLFMNVREKLSLCYYCAARFKVFTRILLVDSGVEAENRQKAQDEILRQLEVMQRGDFTDEDLHNTKLLMKNAIFSATDSLAALDEWYLGQILRGQSVSPEEDAADIDAVTREEVVSVAGGVALDTVYFLTGKEGA